MESGRNDFLERESSLIDDGWGGCVKRSIWLAPNAIQRLEIERF